MVLDCIVLVLVVIAVFRGLSNGLIIGIFSFIAFIVGLAAALKLSAIVAVYLGHSVNISSRLLPVVAFFAVFFIVVLLIRFGAKIIEKIMQFAMLGWLNRLGGVLFYILIYLFIFSVILFYAENMHLLKPETIRSSVSYPYLQPVGPKIINSIGTVLPTFKNMFAQLLHFFETVTG